MKSKTYTKEIRGKRICIVGYGREGKSIARWLAAYDPSISVSVRDRSDGSEYLADLSVFDTVIRSPEVSPYSKEFVSFVSSGGHVTTATNIFFSLCPGRVIGITGTKGKSTTTRLVAHILSSVFSGLRFGGNIGTPMLDHLKDATDETVFVMELSSHQLLDCRYSPHIAVTLPVVPEHLDYYPDLHTYMQAKTRITARQSASDVLVYDVSDEVLAELLSKSRAKVCGYTTQVRVQARVCMTDGIIFIGEHPVVARGDIPLIGNLHAILAAVAVSDVMGVDAETIGTALASFTPLPHRLEPVGMYHGVTYINDSLATIPEATVHALDALGDSVATLIAGGYDRGIPMDVLGKRLAASQVRTLILFPDTGARIKNALFSYAPDSAVAVNEVDSMEEAVKIAVSVTPRGSVCLLSPAAASFNLFTDYADRGNQFSQNVRKYAGS